MTTTTSATDSSTSGPRATVSPDAGDPGPAASAASRTTGSGRPPMTAARKAALAGGLFYLATFVFSIPALAFYDNVLNNPGFVHGAGDSRGVLWGAVFEIITALACIGTAVALYPVVKRHGPMGAIGFVASRTLEAATILVGVMSLLTVYTLRQDHAGTDPAGLATTADAFVAMHNWSFLLGPGIMPAVNALCLATVLYRSRLVPRLIPAVGLIAAPILLASSMATLFGGHDQVSATATLTALPIGAWELALGLWLTCKGFRNTEPAAELERVGASTV